MKTKKTNVVNYALRTLLLILGLFFLALGVALSTKSGLGVSPSAGVAYVLSMLLPLSMGTCTTLLNILYLLIQLAILRREFKPTRLLQLAVVFLFGYFTDFTLWLVSPLQISAYPLRLVLSVLACAVMGFGVFLEVRSRVIVVASEGALSVIAQKTGREFGTIKIINDWTLIAVTLILSLVGLHRIEGVREGTIIAALCVGLFTQLYNRHFHLFDSIFDPDKAQPTETVPASGELPLVVTIEREWGSGGHEIGEMLAKKLGVAFYDYELIEQVAAETGLPAEKVKTHEERVKGVLYTLYNQANAFTRGQSAEDAIFEAQSKIIRELAAKESCVIVGRLGAFILKDRPNSFHLFLSAKDDFRLQNLFPHGGEREKLIDMIHREDDLRAAYCRHFTGRPWGISRHYSMCLDTSVYGLEGSLEMIETALEKRKP